MLAGTWKRVPTSIQPGFEQGETLNHVLALLAIAYGNDPDGARPLLLEWLRLTRSITQPAPLAGGARRPDPAG
jgi:hypothetical protein